MITDERQSLAERAMLTLEIQEFLYYEADLLDERRFREWLDLLADDLWYYMPMRRNIAFGEWERENTREQQDICWMDEDKDTLTKRVKQLETGTHWAEEPFSRVTHMVSNVRIREVDGDQVNVSSRFLVYRNRQAVETDLLVGRRLDRLRRANGSWKIARREILLDQNVLLAKNLTTFF